MKALGYNINLAEGNLTTSRLHTNPVLNNQSLQLTDPAYYHGTEFYRPVNRQVWWQLTKPFVLPSQRRYRIELASQGVSLAARTFEDNVRSFSADVANQWLATWIIRERLDLLNQAYTNIDSLVRINKVRLRNQVITTTELIRTQLLMDQYQLQLISAGKELRNQQQKLRYLLGSADSITVDIEAPIETITIPEQADTLLKTAIGQRGDVLAALAASKAAGINQQYQRSMALPQPELGMIWNPQNTVPYLGIFGTVRIPLFDRNQGEIEKSRYLQLQANEVVRAAQLKVETEIKAAWISYTTEKANLRRYATILEQTEQVLENVRYAYLKGGTTIIDFLDAQRGWFDTRKLHLDALLAYHQSYIQLLYATGLINQL